MGQVSSAEDNTDRAEDAARMDGRVSPELGEIRPKAVDRSVRLSSTQPCKVDRREALPRKRAASRPNPNIRARPLTSSPADVQRKATSGILRMRAQMRAAKKKGGVIIVPD